jgi:hypothetical protein
LKRFISILLGICILFSNTGWALTAHYCMGKRVSVNLRHTGVPDQDHHACAKCGMKKAVSKNGCCHDEEVVFKSTQDAISGMTMIDMAFGVADVPLLSIAICRVINYAYSAEQTKLFKALGPPVHTGPPLFIRNCVFLI